MKIDFRGGKVGCSERTSALRPFDRLRDHRLRERGGWGGKKRSLAPTVRARRRRVAVGNGGGSRNPEWRVILGVSADFSQGRGRF